ncbi:unnamed protein product [Cochlearia groenlandica]
MSKATKELDFFGLDNNKNHITKNISPKPKFKNFLQRRPSFRDMQGAISKMDPEIIKSLLASNGNNNSYKSLSVPSTPKYDHTKIQVSSVPINRQSMDLVNGTCPMTIFYNGTVSVFQVSSDKADNILKIVKETSQKKQKSMEKDRLVIIPTTNLRSKLFGQNLQGDLPITRRKSLQRFLEKRKERLVSTSPYFPTSD